MPAASLVVRVSAQIAEHQKSFADLKRTHEKFASDFEGIATRAAAVGSFIGNIAAKIATSLASAFGQGLRDAIRLSSEFQNAFIGLNSVARAFGVDADRASEAARRLSSDGLLPLKDSATGLKNLLAAGFNLEQSTQLMNAFKDSAAFGRQGALSFGDAIRSATEGVKNGNSILVDNAGVTKNLSQILKEAGFSAQDLSRASSDAGVRMALFNGILKETRAQLGDSDRLSQTFTGSLTRMNTAWNNLQATWGDAITQNATVARALQAVGDAFIALNTHLSNNRNAFNLVSDAVILFAKVLSGVIAAIDVTLRAVNIMDTALKTVVNGFANAGQAVASMLIEIAKIGAKLPGGTAALGIYAQELRGLVVAEGLFSDVARSSANDIKNNAERVTKWGAVLGGARTSLADLVVELEKTRGKTVELGDQATPALERVGKAVGGASEVTKSFVKNLNELTAEIGLANRNYASLATLVEVFGSAADKAATKADAWGIAVSLNVREVANAFREAKFNDFLVDFFDKQAKASKKHWDGIVKDVEDAGKRWGDAFLKNFDVQREVFKDIESLEFDSLAKRLRAVRKDAEDRRAQLNRNSSNYRESLAVIDQLERRSAELATFAWEQHVTDTKRSMSTFKNIFLDALQGIPDLIKNAFTGGGGLSGALGAFTSDLGSKLGTKVFGELAAKLSNALSSTFGVAFTSAMGILIPGIGAVIGSMLDAGFWSRLTNKLSSGLSNIFDTIGLGWEKDGRRMVEQFAAGLGGFDSVKRRLDTLGTEGARLWKKLTQEVGSDATTQAIAAIFEVDRALKSVAVTSRTELQKGIDDAIANFNRLAKEGRKTGKNAEAELNAAISAIEAAEAAFAEGLKKRVEAINSAIDGVNRKAELFADPFRKLLESQKALKDNADTDPLQLDVVNAKLAEMGQRGQAEFERIGIFAAAAFAGFVRETGDVLGAIKALTPAFTVLQDGVRVFGLESSGVINKLLRIFDLVNDAVSGPIIQSIQATGQIFSGLQVGGLITRDIFQTVATDIGESFRELEAKGGDVAGAMALSQPILQKLWEGQQLYGQITDETTQKVLRQAEEQGLVGDHMKDVNQKILEVLISIADVFGADIPESFRKTREAAKETAQSIEHDLARIRPPEIRVRVGYDVDEVVLPGVEWNGPQLARGGIVRRPTLALIGEAGPEAVVPLSHMGTVAQPGSSTVILEVDGRMFAEVIVPHLPGAVRRRVHA